jgi:predicted RecB family nuclease
MLFADPSPPDLVLNRHCAECEFRVRCRHKAHEIDDLSLLSGIGEKERSRHRSKGIFTVTQLSYTFRPRRTPKRSKAPVKPHNFALQALAIRENTVYVSGTPQLPNCKSQIYLDIEGLPSRAFYYLIGALVIADGQETFHSFWANTESGQAAIFVQFAEMVSKLPDFRIFHYGDYDATAIKRTAKGLSETWQERFDTILERRVNVLSAVHSHVYFPTYSNSLKGIQRPQRYLFRVQGNNPGQLVCNFFFYSQIRQFIYFIAGDLDLPHGKIEGRIKQQREQRSGIFRKKGVDEPLCKISP